MTPILSLTFAPPIIAVKGLSGFDNAFPIPLVLYSLRNQKLLVNGVQFLLWKHVHGVQHQMHRLHRYLLIQQMLLLVQDHSFLHQDKNEHFLRRRISPSVHFIH